MNSSIRRSVERERLERHRGYITRPALANARVQCEVACRRKEAPKHRRGTRWQL